MSNTDNIDRFGHCVICHRYMISTRVIDGKPQIFLQPEYDQTEFLMNNGSRLVVCLCKICENTYDLTDPKIHTEVMDSCKKGWLLEDQLMLRHGLITEEKISENTNNRKDLSIEIHSEGISDEFIRERQNKLVKIIAESPK